MESSEQHILKAYEHGALTEYEKDLYIVLVRAQMTWDQVSDMVYEHLKSKYLTRIRQAESVEQLKAIREELRPVPESSSLMLIFRAIYMREDELVASPVESNT